MLVIFHDISLFHVHYCVYFPLIGMKEAMSLKQKDQLCEVEIYYASKVFDCGSVIYCYTVLHNNRKALENNCKAL